SPRPPLAPRPPTPRLDLGSAAGRARGRSDLERPPVRRAAPRDSRPLPAPGRRGPGLDPAAPLACVGRPALRRTRSAAVASQSGERRGGHRRTAGPTAGRRLALYRLAGYTSRLAAR